MRAYTELKRVILEEGEPPCATAEDKTPWQKHYPKHTNPRVIAKACEECPLAIKAACLMWGRADGNFSGVAGGMGFRLASDERGLDLEGNPLANVGGTG